jgi:hypothetical protein
MPGAAKITAPSADMLVGGATPPPASVGRDRYAFGSKTPVVGGLQAQVQRRDVLDDVLHPPLRSRVSISSTSRLRIGMFSFISLSLHAPGNAGVDHRTPGILGVEARCRPPIRRERDGVKEGIRASFHRSRAAYRLTL